MAPTGHTVDELCNVGPRGDLWRGRELTQNLVTYLAFGMNANKTARELYMHRNTLLYRIDQVERYLGVKLAQLDACGIICLELECLEALGWVPGANLRMVG